MNLEWLKPLCHCRRKGEHDIIINEKKVNQTSNMENTMKIWYFFVSCIKLRKVTFFSYCSTQVWCFSVLWFHCYCITLCFYCTSTFPLQPSIKPICDILNVFGILAIPVPNHTHTHTHSAEKRLNQNKRVCATALPWSDSFSLNWDVWTFWHVTTGTAVSRMDE